MIIMIIIVQIKKKLEGQKKSQHRHLTPCDTFGLKREKKKRRREEVGGEEEEEQ